MWAMFWPKPGGGGGIASLNRTLSSRDIRFGAGEGAGAAICAGYDWRCEGDDLLAGGGGGVQDWILPGRAGVIGIDFGGKVARLPGPAWWISRRKPVSLVGSLTLA